ncbi:hypothetical protein OGAPHI_005417 [Ogataea philodendri]|uniref:Uncharacterized protein n=1 Tax=Ogataea philodendri TaxID=1378263 RepID=A0A9P8NZ69_9ASCO|nr:uncharacterized protein OGAPHI_005417 [Ogataea philodendri]KAH3662169.1 hypothetical protein OGAPHI_005417 [Ogataea philodendri]
MEDTAMNSAEEAEVTAMKTMIKAATAPPLPIMATAALGRTKPADTCQSHGSRNQPWNSKPSETTKNVTWESSSWTGGNSLVPISVIKENGTEVTDNVDNEENTSGTRIHGEVRTVGISVNRVLLSCSHNQIPDFAWRSQKVTGSVGSEGEGQDDDNDGNGVCVIGQESCLNTTKQSVDNHTNWEKITSSNSIHTSEITDDGRATG